MFPKKLIKSPGVYTINSITQRNETTAYHSQIRILLSSDVVAIRWFLSKKVIVLTAPKCLKNKNTNKIPCSLSTN